MRIKQIYINGYRNLNDTTINFDTTSQVTAFIGNNGSGKSNLLECLTTSFFIANDSEISKQLLEKIEYATKIIYHKNDCEYVLDLKQNFLAISENGIVLKKEMYRKALPKSIFLYYSGETKRLGTLAMRLDDKKYEQLLKDNKNVDYKYLNYFSLADLEWLFIANYVFQTETFKTIKNTLKLDYLSDDIEIILKRPSWASKTSKSSEFWSAKGYIKDCCDKLMSVATSSSSDNDFQKIDIKLSKIKSIFPSIKELFIALKAFSIYEMIEDIFTVSVLAKEDERLIMPTDFFSEGEKQLSMLSFLMGATNQEEVLYLFDEPDAYLHPNWQRDFATMLNNATTKGQMLFTTHSPLTLSKLNAKNIFLMQNGDAIPIADNTYNRDIGELLEEVMDVSLRAPDIEEKMNKFRKLIAHGNKDEAEKIYSELIGLLSESDPYHITAQLLLKRLER